MYPTRLQVKTRYLQRLDDPLASVFTEPVFTEAFGEAYDAMYQAFLLWQCPRIELVATWIVQPGVTSLTPAQMGIADFGDFIWLRERTYGAGERFIDLIPVDTLSQRPLSERLVEFNWRNNTFFFVGANTIRELQIKYDGSGTAPTADNTAIQVDSCLTFLSNYAVGVSGGQKGYDDTARRCMSLAVGPRYDSGVIGGDLMRLISPSVRSRQNVVVAPRPFSARRRLWRGFVPPYVVGTSSMASTPDGYQIVTPDITGTVIIDLSRGLNVQLALSQSNTYTIYGPSTTGFNTVVPGSRFYLYLDNPGNGLLPIFLGGAGNFGANTASLIQMDPVAGTRSAYGFKYHPAGIWLLDEQQTGVQTT